MDNKKVTKVTKIAWNYFITSFIFDFLAIIPFTSFYFPVRENSEIENF